MRFSEFSDALSPLDKIYKDHLEKKRPNYDVRHPEEALSLYTKLALGDVFRK
jgi:hypothetical protein